MSILLALALAEAASGAVLLERRAVNLKQARSW